LIAGFTLLRLPAVGGDDAWPFQQQGGWIVPAAAGVPVGAVWALRAEGALHQRAADDAPQGAGRAARPPELKRPAAAPPGLS
jgi:hypothetical protein